MKKRFILLSLIFALVLTSISVCADETEFLSVLDEQRYVVVAGKADVTYANKNAVLFLVKNGTDVENPQSGDIGFIDQTVIKDDGSYCFEFSFANFTYDNEGKINNYTVYLSIDGANQTKTITKASSVGDFVSFDIDSRQLSKMNAVLKNKLGLKWLTYTGVAAFYNDQGLLIGTQIADNYIKDTGIVYDAPENTSKIKMFIWDSSERMIPLCESKQKTVRPLRFLMIGNSLSEDASQYLHGMAEADGLQLDQTVMLVGGKRIKDHWTYLNEQQSVYLKYYNGTRIPGKFSLYELLSSNEYDVISLQQYANWAYQDTYYTDSEYYPYLQNIIQTIKALQPNAEIVMYENWCEHFSNTANMDLASGIIKNATAKAAETAGKLVLPDGSTVSEDASPLRIMPSGRAFRIAANNGVGMLSENYEDFTLYRDSDHASYIYGRYLTDAVIYEVLTGRDISNNTFLPVYNGTEANTEYIEILKQAAHAAVMSLSEESTSQTALSVENLTIAPGINETARNFAWYSPVYSSGAKIQYAKATDVVNGKFPQYNATTVRGSYGVALNESGTAYSNCCKAEITNLEFNTEYVYRVGDNNSWTKEYYTFKTGPDPKQNDFQWVMTSDIHLGNSNSITDSWKKTINCALDKANGMPAFWLNTGDQVTNANIESEYDLLLEPEVFRSLPFAVVKGHTHDFNQSQTISSLFMRHFNMPNMDYNPIVFTPNTGGNYSFMYGDVLFVCPDFNSSSSAVYELNKAYMKEQVELHPEAKWKVLVVHQSLYGGYYDVVTKRNTYMGTIAECGFDLVVGGHHHTPVRTYPLKNNQIKSTQLHNYENVDGTVFLTLQTGTGAYPRSFTDENGNEYTDCQLYAAFRLQDKLPHYTLVTRTADSLKFETRRTSDNEIVDYFTLKKTQ